MRSPLLLIIAGLLALGLQLWALQAPDVADPVAVRSPPRPAGAPAPQAPARSPYTVGSLRSPFDLPRPGEAADGVANSDTLSLAGLVRAGGSASAVVRDPSGASHVLRPGDSLQGWRLDGVGRDDVTLSRGAEHRTLSLNGPPAVLNRTSP